jgi:hypothetical protein
MDILRSKKSPYDKNVVIDMDQAGWVRTSDLIVAVQDELPGVKVSIARLISLVYDDRFQCLQMWRDDPRATNDTELVPEHFNKIRAVSGHDASCNVDHRRILKDRQKFQLNSRRGEYGGPENVFYYISLAGMMKIWEKDGITPDCAVFAPKGKTLIYCTPVSVYNNGCPEACKHSIEEQNKSLADFQITIDLELIMKDGLECFYTADGYVAIDCDLLAPAYIKQVIGVKTGQFWYYRQFVLRDCFFGETTPKLDRADTRAERSVLEERCIVCNSLMWTGSLTCINCFSPMCYETGFPDVDLANIVLLRLDTSIRCLRKLLRKCNR